MPATKKAPNKKAPTKKPVKKKAPIKKAPTPAKKAPVKKSQAPGVPRLGAKVHWASQVKGSTTLKRGVVYKIVEPLKAPLSEFAYEQLSRKYHLMFKVDSIYRKHQSVLVLVSPAEGSKSKPKLYWPLVSQLEVL